MQVVPFLHTIAAQGGTSPTSGMELVQRILCDFQQDYFAWCNEQAMGPAVPPAAPTFAELVKAVRTFRCEGLSPMPASWYGLMNAPKQPRASQAADRSTPAERKVSVPEDCDRSQADTALFARHQNSGKSSISALLEGHDVVIPKQGGKPVCLTWALKGTCTTGCKRHRSHITCTRTTNGKIHALLTTCGVANPQE